MAQDAGEDSCVGEEEIASKYTNLSSVGIPAHEKLCGDDIIVGRNAHTTGRDISQNSRRVGETHQISS